MAVRPAVQGLLKHELILTNRQTRDQCVTIWTYKNAYPVAGARLTYERAQIRAWLTSHWRQVSNTSVVAEVIRTKDFGVSPPARYDPEYIIPTIPGTGGLGMDPRVSAIVALRTQAIGSVIRNRNNGRLYHGNLIYASVDRDFGLSGSGYAGTIDAAYENLLTRLDPVADANSGDWSVVSFFSAGGVRPVPLVTPINHVLVRSLAGIQRRRVAHAGPYTRGS